MSSNIEVKLDVLNQKASPALYAASLADRPAASFTGRLFVDSDSPSTGLYRDTGSSWIQIADAGAGTSGTLQQVTTNGNTTNVGISVTANGIGIGVAAPAANLLDIHGTTGVLAQLENTTTQNSLLSFRNQGAGVWSIGNGYNAGANDFIVYDAVSFVNRLTIKATGQTFIGADTTSSGLFVVNSATSDNHIVILGANAPSLRFRNAGTGGTLNAGIGISTATNNFIQGSASGNYCLFNSSTTASPILFGIYDSGAGNTVEAARISAARNFLLGGTSDNGKKLQVTGDIISTATITATTTFIGNSAGLPALSISSSGSFYGQILPVSNIAFSLGYGSSATSSGNSVLSWTTGNNVGIGTSAPASMWSGSAIVLHTKSSSTLAASTRVESANSSIELVASGSSNKNVIYSPSNVDLEIYTNGNLYLILKSTGILNLKNVPTSSAGLVTGDIYQTAGILNIV